MLSHQDMDKGYDKWTMSKKISGSFRNLWTMEHHLHLHLSSTDYKDYKGISYWTI